MRIVCDNCGAKYEVKDEKVRKKVFKIRCKRCSHEFVVRGTQDAAQEQAAPEAAEVAAPQAATATPDDEATKVVDYSARQRELAEEEGAVWHVVINREQVGGLTAGDVLAYFGRGDVDADTFTWREGMADWARLSTVPEFADAVASATSQIGGDEPDLGATAAIDLTAAPPVEGSPYAEEDVMASNNVAEASGTAGGLFGGIDDLADPRITDPSQLRNQRNENSVLFSLDSLTEGANRASAPAAVSNSGGSEASGLIDMSLLDSGGSPVGNTQSEMDALFGASSGPGAMPMSAGVPIQPLVRRKKSKIPMFLGIAAGMLILIGGTAAVMMYLLDKDGVGTSVAANANANANANAPAPPGKLSLGGATKTPPPGKQAGTTEAPAAGKDGNTPEATTEATADAKPTAAAKPTKKPTQTRRSRSRGTKGKRVVKTTGSSRLASATGTTKPRRPKVRPKPRPTKNDEVDDLLGALDGKPPPQPTGRRRGTGGGGPPPDPADDPLLPDKLGSSQILTVVRRGSGKIRNCKAGTGAVGTIKVRITVAKSGRVTKAKVISPNFQGTPVGRCVEGKVKSFRFPSFRQAAQSFTMPFAL